MTTARVALEARGVVVRYGDVQALRGVDLIAEQGQVVALLGPSGSGKTTLLDAIAGFLPLAGGEIHLDGRLVSSAQWCEVPERRSMGVVFQHYGLWPHLDALDTVAYPLRRAGSNQDEARREARRLLERMGMEHLAGRRPAELSGGEQQRVGLARALARRPAILLLDEPTAHLDAVIRADVRAELAHRIRDGGVTAILATHDVEEALAVADRVVLLRDGLVIQDDVPEEVYARPVDAWAARMTGQASFIRGTMRATEQGTTLQIRDVSWPLDVANPAAAAPSTTAPASMDGHPDGQEDSYLIRPDWIRFEGPIEATVQSVRYGGAQTDYELETVAGRLVLRDAGPPRHAVGVRTTCGIDRIWRMPTDHRAAGVTIL